MDGSRPPVSTFDQALWWLIGHSPAVVEFIETNGSLDQMPLEAVLVCDLFWVTKDQLRLKLVRALREISPPPLLPSRDLRFSRGVR